MAKNHCPASKIKSIAIDFFEIKGYTTGLDFVFVQGNFQEEIEFCPGSG
jgi:hypothetical protein